MRQAVHSLSVPTHGKGLAEITAQVSSWVSGQNITTGLLTIFCRHTSASLLIQENADPDVRTDLETFFEEIAPEGWHALHPSQRRPRRHAGAYPRRALTRTSVSPFRDRRGTTRPRDLAGRLSLRAPAARRIGGRSRCI